MFPSASARANFFAVCLLSVTALVPTASAAQTLPPVDTSVRQSFERVLSDPRVKAALAAIERAEPEAIKEQFRLTEIPAPPFKEEKRAALLS
jgi:predicted transcriptional regulator